MYADYDYYINSFSGIALSEKEFPSLSAKAERYLDYVTQHRVTDVTDAVKNAVCAAAEALHEVNRQYEKIPQGVKSENTDGYSVTYSEADAREIKCRQDEAMLDAIVQALSGTNLLYQGVS